MSYFETETGMRGLASKFGLRYAATVKDQGFGEDIGDLPDLPLFTEGSPENISDLMYGRHDGLNLMVFHFDPPTYKADPHRPRRSCVCITFTATFPKVTIGPHTRMSRISNAWTRAPGLTVPQEFVNRYQLTGDREAVTTIFDKELVAWFMRGSDQVTFELADGALMGHISRIEDDDFPALIKYVRQFHAAIPQAAWVKYSIF